MLTIVVGIREETIWATSKFFDQAYEPEWITDELSIKMIKDVDQSEVISERLINSPYLGSISPKELSGGVKTLMLIKFMPEFIFNGNQLGENCLDWLLEICKEEDRAVWFGYIPVFIDYNKNKPTDKLFKIRIIDDKGKDYIAYSQRDITNITIDKLTCEPVDTSDIEELAIKLHEESIKNIEEEYFHKWLIKLENMDPNTIEYKILSEEFVEKNGDDYKYLLER